MALTLVEAAKAEPDMMRSGVIELYARSSALLMVLPFMDITGNALAYNQEGALPGIGFRGVNEGYEESTGVINPQSEALVIAGGDLDVDQFILKTRGEGTREAQEAMKIKSLAHKWTHTFFKGDAQTTPKEFDGLQVRLTGPQLIDAGGTSGGDPMSLAKLDEAIDAVDNPQAIFMNKTLIRRMTAAARTEAVAGHIEWSLDSFGRRVATYNGLPLLPVGDNGDIYNTLDFTEANPGGGASVGTSVYVVGFGEDLLTGIQNGTIDIRDIGELEAKPSKRSRVEWYSGMAVFHPRAAARLRGITNAAIVA